MAAAAAKKAPQKPVTVDLIEKFQQQFNRDLTTEEKRALIWAEQFTYEPYVEPKPENQPVPIDRRREPRK